jgi:transposase-like protein
MTMEDGKGKKTRRRMGERSWRDVLARYDASAVTVQEFCLREGLTRSSFTRWRARLCDGARQWPAGHVGTVARVPADVPKPGFMDLGSLGEATAVERAGPVDLRIDLGGGLSLHLVRR